LRFSVTYRMNSVPIDYRMKVYSLLKEAIRRVDETYYKKIFVKQQSEMKPFSFAVFLKDFSMTETKILLKELTITISSTMEFAVHAFNGLRTITSYEIVGETWTQTNLQLLKEANITSGIVYMKTLSPILVEDKQGKPLSPNDEKFEAELNYFANLKVKHVEGRELFKPIRFTPFNMKKTVVKESNQVFRKTNKNASLYFTTYRGSFKLEGHPNDLQILYQLGIGKRTSFFGLIEYVREEV